MGGIVIVIIFFVISAISTAAKRFAASNQQGSRPAAPKPPQHTPEGEGGKWHDEYYGEGLPPSKNVCDPRGSHGPHTPHAKVSVPEPRQRTREAPKATVKSSLKNIAAADEVDAPATIEIGGTDMSFTGENALKAVLYAEILGKPKALR